MSGSVRSRNVSSASSSSVAASASASASASSSVVASTTNWSAGGVGQGSFIMLGLLVLLPVTCQMIAYSTSEEAYENGHHISNGLTGIINGLSSSSALNFVTQCFIHTKPTLEHAAFIAAFFAVVLIIDAIAPGNTGYGPETATGHIPCYKDNGLKHCILSCFVFLVGSDLGFLSLYEFGIFFRLFPGLITCLNIFGLLLACFLYIKGLYFPSTRDSGTTGSFISDYAWGTELYPRVAGVDIKRLINCRFSMTFWMIAGVSFSYSSYQRHGTIDYGLSLSALSQFLYLVKFFLWELGYLNSIDIILDRAGWQIQWGCLVWVPTIYTLHTRLLVISPSNITLEAAIFIATVGLIGVYLNYAADVQRQEFRLYGPEKYLIWGSPARYVEAKYTTTLKNKDGTDTHVQKKSTLLASGYWGPARHFHYVFELIAAWSWCLLANPLSNGTLVLFYSVFLTILLIDRAKRDEEKCRRKYGKDYEKFAKLVPYLIFPGIY